MARRELSGQPLVKSLGPHTCEIWVPLDPSDRLGVPAGRRTPAYVGLSDVGADFRERPEQPPSHVALLERTADFGQVAEPVFGCVHGLAGDKTSLQAIVVGLERRQAPDVERAVASVPLGEFDDLVELPLEEALRQIEAMQFPGGLRNVEQGRQGLLRDIREAASSGADGGGVAVAQVARVARVLPHASEACVRVACGTWSKYGPGLARIAARGMLDVAALVRRGWLGRMSKRPLVPMSVQGTPWPGDR